MLSRLARVVVPALLLGVLAGCSGGGASADATGAPGAGTDATEAVTAVFTGYSDALLARDFPAACAALTDDARQALVADLNTRDIPAQDCEQAYAALYATDAASALDEQGRTIRVTDVRVDGATATLTYTGTVGDRQLTQTVRAVQVAGGGWQIAPGA